MLVILDGKLVIITKLLCEEGIELLDNFYSFCISFDSKNWQIKDSNLTCLIVII